MKFINGRPSPLKGLTKYNSESVAKSARAKIGKKRPDIIGAKHPLWKGDKAGYFSVHGWLNSNFGKANCCEFSCNKVSKRFEWALKKGKTYTHKRENFIQLCVSCHRIYDMTTEHRKNMSTAARLRWLDPNKRPNRKPMSEETKRKISLAKRGQKSWNTGLTKKDHPSIVIMAEKAKSRMTGKKGEDSPVWKRWHHDSTTPFQEPE